MGLSTLLPRMDTNPQVYFNRNVLSGKAYKKIIDYLPRQGKNIDEELSIWEGVSIKMVSGTKCKLVQTSPAQWIVYRIVEFCQNTLQRV